MTQLPAGAEGVAAAVLSWSFFCFASNILMLWLLWTGRERSSYIFIIGSISLIATTSSIIEQINDIIYYEDVMWARLRWIKADAGNPLQAASDGGVGVGLVMWTIRWACYISQSGTAFFWSFSLTQVVYGWRDDSRFHGPLVFIGQVGKVFPTAVAILTMAVLQITSLQKTYVWWNVILNLFYCMFLVAACFMFFLIFLEFLQTRKLLQRMNSHQRRQFVGEVSPVDIGRASPISARVMAGLSGVEIGPSFGALRQRQGGIYDKWLVARTAIPVLMLTLFEFYNIYVNTSRPAEMAKLSHVPAPDLSAATARAYLVAFMPGCLASLVLLLAFGTTENFRGRIYQLVVPARLQSAGRRRRHRVSRDMKYVAMDHDGGILSRSRRLSMEQHLRIQVTYEFEVRNESVASKDGDGGKKGGEPGPGGTGGSLIYPYSVESHRWDDTERILPKQPSVSFIRGQS